MKKLLLTLGAVALTASVVSAQHLPKNNFHNNQIGTYDRVSQHGPYLTGRFFDNTFLGVAGGVNLYNYKYPGSKKPSFGKRGAMALDISLGKWVTPTVGLRAMYSGMQAKSLYALVDGQKDLLHKMKISYFHGDLLIDLTNAFAGYNERRFWDLVPFVGAGYARAKDKNVALNSHKMAATAGLLNNFRLGHRVDFTLEARWMFVDRLYDGIAAGTRYDRMFTLTAGLALKMGPKGGFKRPVFQTPIDVTGYENRIKTLEGDVARDRSTIDRLNRELDAAKKRPATVEKVTSPVSITTYFELGKSNVNKHQMENLKTMADIIKANPERKFNVTGYADAGTGTKDLNLKLSQQRASNVADILVKSYGVNRSQLVITGKGGVEKHPNIPVLDRVVITQ